MNETAELQHGPMGSHQLTEEDALDLYDMARRGLPVTYDDRTGTDLRAYAFSHLVAINPDEYAIARSDEAYDTFQQSVSEPVMKLFPIDLLQAAYGTDDISEIPSEDLLEAYEYQADLIARGGWWTAYADNLSLADSHWETLRTYRDLLAAGGVLYERGFDIDDLHLAEVLRIAFSVTLAGCSMPSLDESAREDAYLDLKNLYGAIFEGEAFNRELEARGIELSLEQTMLYIVGRSTDSISLDVLAAYHDYDPKDKTVKRQIRAYKRALERDSERFSGLSELGKAAAARLGIYDLAKLTTQAMVSAHSQVMDAVDFNGFSRFM